MPIRHASDNSKIQSRGSVIQSIPSLPCFQFSRRSRTGPIRNVRNYCFGSMKCTTPSNDLPFSPNVWSDKSCSQIGGVDRFTLRSHEFGNRCAVDAGRNHKESRAESCNNRVCRITCTHDALEYRSVNMEHRRPLNILISSSRQWNPGDEFIMLGVRRLLRSLLGQDLNYLLWNRNPDLFVDRWHDALFRPGFLTNSAVEPSLDVIDLVVLAGTPEWHGRPVERIFQELLRFPEVPLLALGIGGAAPGFILSPLEREIFTRENTLVVCRNPVLAAEVNVQIEPNTAFLMPCPALFCSLVDQPRSVTMFSRTQLAVAVQGDSVVNQSAPTDFVNRIIHFMREVARPSEFCHVAHYVEEFLRFSRLQKNAQDFLQL